MAWFDTKTENAGTTADGLMSGSEWNNHVTDQLARLSPSGGTFTGAVTFSGTTAFNSTITPTQIGSVTNAQLNYVSGATSNLQTQVSNKLPLSGGTLNGDLVMSGNNIRDVTITSIQTAAQVISGEQVCYLGDASAYLLADSSAEATAKGDLLLATENIGSGATGTFIEYGDYTTTGLTAGSTYYISETTGAITLTAPTTSTSIVRIVGYAKSSTVLVFKPDQSYVENA